MKTIELTGVQVEVDTERGVLYVHDKGTGHTILRMTGLNHPPVSFRPDAERRPTERKSVDVARIEVGWLIVSTE